MRGDALQFYLRPEPKQHYAYGLDPAAGRGGDPGSLVVLSPEGEEAVCFRSAWAGYQALADLAWELHTHGYPVAQGDAYGETGGGLVPEANNEALMLALGAANRFPQNAFFQQEKGASPGHPEGRAVRYGWWTGQASKKLLLDQFVEAAEQGLVRWHNPWLAQEAGRWQARGDGWEYDVPKGMQDVLGHGDVTLATALAYQGLLALQASAQVTPFVRTAESVRSASAYWAWRDRNAARPRQRQGRLAVR